MRFLVNTNYDRSAAGRVVLGGIEERLAKAGYALANNDWNNYEHDVFIFMAPDSKVLKTKQAKPDAICGIFDPKTTHRWQLDEIRAADFLVVSSIEQREYFLKYNPSIFIYYMFPDVPSIPKVHVKKEKILIGYHGNKQHLVAMKDVSWALDELAKKYSIELMAIYNVKKLGKWTKNAPKVCPIRHVQWRETEFVQDLKECDIGISPAALPVTFISRLIDRPPLSPVAYFNSAGFNANDYILRFKYSNNPGRLHVFAQLDLPVVTDFSPSSCQMIVDGKSGHLVGTKEGWYRGLEQLILDAQMRNSMAKELRLGMEPYTPDPTFAAFIEFIGDLYAKRK